MRADIEKLGLSFQYPDNWELDQAAPESGRSEVTVYSPGGAFWSVTVYPRKSDPDQLAEEAVEALKAEYRDLDVEPVTQEIADRELSGYDLNFFCMDLTNTALVRSLRTPKATYVFVCQAEDREFDRIEPVFRAMTTSLLQEEKKEVGSGA